MKIRTEPLLGATAFSFVLLLISNLVSTFITYNNVNQMMKNMMSPNFDPFSAQTSMFSPLIGLLGCFVTLVAGIGAGIVYAVLHNRVEPLTGSAAKGGAAAGALSFFLSGMISAILASLMMVPVLNQMNALMFAELGAMDPSVGDVTSMVTGFGVVGALIGGICGGIFFAIVGAILGALGGVFGKSFAKPTAPPAQPV